MARGSSRRRRLAEHAPVWARRARERQTSRHALRLLAEIASGRGPVVAGPWLSEVGFELLYWIPLLAWLREERGLGPDRVTAITRGGAGAWYGNVAAHTVDALDAHDPDEIRTWRDARAAAGSEKQAVPTAAERELFETAAASVAPDVPAWLHPSLMYHVYNVALRWTDDLSLLTRYSRYEPLPAPPAPPPGLPRPYVAVKAYFSRCFPATSANRDFLRGLLETLRARSGVVLLRTPEQLDEHAEETDVPEGVVTYTPGEARTNLEAQSAVVAGASAFVSTYGGFSYLGPLLGVPTSAFYSEPQFNPLHVEVQRQALAALNADPAAADPVHVADFDPEAVLRDAAEVA